MKITLKDGSVKEYDSAKSVYEIAADLSEGLARAACAGELDGEVVDLRTVVDKDCSLNILTASDPEGLRVIRHTCSHVMAEAVKRLFPQSKLAIGPAIDTGYYYDFEHEPFSRDDLDKIEAEMKKIIKEGHELKRFTLPRNEAIQFMKDREEPYKVEDVYKRQAETDRYHDRSNLWTDCAPDHGEDPIYRKSTGGIQCRTDLCHDRTGALHYHCDQKETGLLFFLCGIFKHRGQPYDRCQSLSFCMESFSGYGDWNRCGNRRCV